MTRLTTKLMIAAAALVAAGAASAQTMRADIPFAFRAGGSGKVMAAGRYSVNLRGLGGTVAFQGRHKGAVVALPITHKAGAESTPTLVFACGPGTCRLIQIWPGDSEPGLVFSTPKSSREEEASLIAIPLRPEHAL